jgi:hypothetical protein
MPARPHLNARRVIFAVQQPEYDPLPASVDASGVVMTEWEFSAEDLARVLEGGRLRLWLYTHNRPLQPVMLEVVQ